MRTFAALLIVIALGVVFPGFVAGALLDQWYGGFLGAAISVAFVLFADHYLGRMRA